MKLETSIALRNDGTVTFGGLDGVRYNFTLDQASGLVVADVPHEPTVAVLLRTGSFFPVDEADHEKASALMTGAVAAQAADEQAAEEVELDDDPVDPNAMPIEGAMPPAPRRKAKATE